MAVSFYLSLKADGSQISGESQDDRYSGWIEVLAYEFAGSRAGAGQAGARRSSHLSMGNFKIRKRVDQASPLIMKALCTNQTIECKLVLRKAGGEMEDYGTLELKNGVIAGMTQGNLAFGGEYAEEEIEISYQTIRMLYNVQTDTGIARGGIEFEHTIMGAT